MKDILYIRIYVYIYINIHTYVCVCHDVRAYTHLDFLKASIDVLSKSTCFECNKHIIMLKSHKTYTTKGKTHGGFDMAAPKVGKPTLQDKINPSPRD